VRKKGFASNLLAFHEEKTEKKMANLTIRNLDDEVVEKLKARAKENERSLEAEIRVLLTATTERPSRKAFRELAERIAALTPDMPQTDSVELIHEDRDR
jgi:plasmid stability protein